MTCEIHDPWQRFLADFRAEVPASLLAAGFTPALARDAEGRAALDAGAWPFELVGPDVRGNRAVVRRDPSQFALASRREGARDVEVDHAATLAGAANAYRAWDRRARAVFERLLSGVDVAEPAWSAPPFEAALFAKLADGTPVLARVDLAVPPHVAAFVSISRVVPKGGVPQPDTKAAEVKALPFSCPEDLDVFFWTTFAEVASGVPTSVAESPSCAGAGHPA